MLPQVKLSGRESLFTYIPKSFDELNDFHIAQEQLNKYDEIINFLGAIICKHALDDVVGVCLLHKHFRLTEKEILLRQYSSTKRATMKPHDKGAFLSTSVPYMWSYSTGPNGNKDWFPLEFVAWEKNEPIPDLSFLSYSKGFLDEFGDYLSNHNVDKLFGISALYSRIGFNLEENETVLETTDEKNRILTLEVCPSRIIKSSEGDIVQTMWTFNSLFSRSAGISNLI